MASNGSTFSVIGTDVSIKGDIKAEADLHVDGSIQGDIHCTSLVQGEASEIKGQINADQARLAGTVNGSINVRELVVLKSAHIEGDVHYDALTIEQGAVVEGQFAQRGANRAAAAKPGLAKPAGAEGPKSPDDEPKLSLAN